MNIPINSLQHIGIPVTDIGHSERFYQRLGFSLATSSPFEIPSGKGRMSMMQLGEIVIELYQLPESDLHEIRTRRNGHVDHIAFDVADIEATLAAVRASGFQVVDDEPVFLPFWKKGVRFFFILGPDGERLEFNQILK